MDTQPGKIELKWYHIRCVRLTGEYCGGLIAGFGFGIWTTVWLTRPEGYWSLLDLVGMGLIVVGGYIALHAQGRYVSGDDEVDEGGEEERGGVGDSPRERPWKTRKD